MKRLDEGPGVEPQLLLHAGELVGGEGAEGGDWLSIRRRKIEIREQSRQRYSSVETR